jgi:hypothetical protein
LYRLVSTKGSGIPYQNISHIDDFILCIESNRWNKPRHMITTDACI